MSEIAFSKTYYGLGPTGLELRTKKSILANTDKFINCLSLADLFKGILELPEIELGFIRNQQGFSNNKRDELMYFNMNDNLLDKFNDFCDSYGFVIVNGWAFYGYPVCACARPKSIYFKPPFDFIPSHFLEWFNKKEFNYNHLPELDWCRDNDRVYRNDDHVYTDNKGTYYFPFNMCDSLKTKAEGGSGCSSPSDTGFIRKIIKQPSLAVKYHE